MAVRTVAVGDPRESEMAIASYSAAGFFLVNKTETSALLRKPKQFNVLLAILGALLYLWSGCSSTPSCTRCSRTRWSSSAWSTARRP